MSDNVAPEIEATHGLVIIVLLAKWLSHLAWASGPE